MHFDWTKLSFSGVSERIWRIFLLLITGLLVFLTYYCVSRGITTIFMHLYYFPIIVFAYRYQKKGVVCSALLGLSYVGMVVYFNSSNSPEIIGAFERFFTFMGVALIIAYLSIHLTRKQSEIQDLSLFQENIISNAQMWLMVLDAKGNILIWNKAAEDLSGYLSREVIGKNTIWKQLYPGSQYRKMVSGTIARIISENRYLENFNTVITSKNGKEKIISWNTRAIPHEKGSTPTFLAIGIDITEQKIAQDLLKESEAQYSALFYNNHSVSLLINPDTGMIVDANNAACDYYGYSLRQLTAMRIFDLNRLPAEQVLRDLKAAKNQREKHFFSRHFLASGELRNVEIYSGPITVKAKPLFYSIIHDITERKKAEKALQDNETLYRTVFENTGTAMVMVEEDTKISLSNTEFARLVGLTRKEIEGKKSWTEFVLPEDLERMIEQHKLRRKRQEAALKKYEFRLISIDNQIHDVLLYIDIIPDTKKSIASLIDITELKKAQDLLRHFNEELEQKIRERTVQLQALNLDLEKEVVEHELAEKQIRAALNEKMVLLQEIHHRVKNNLQIIISLLNLQTRQISDENVKKVLQESQNRIRVMALVHEKLYRSDDISQIILSEYIRNLITTLLNFYSLDRRGIAVKVEMKDIPLNIDTAIPVGLIINELVTNSLKHAFPDGRKGEISLSVQKENRILNIIFKDDGVGIPSGFDWRNAPSLGLRLIITLVEQLNGTIELDRNNGTSFIITLTEK
ncbi:MAG: PAS domain S-box protein [Methanoregula sp.]|nr:PAS domain S-box protein [Methanoregula sp.]